MNKQNLKTTVKETSLDIEEIVQAYCSERKLKLLSRHTRYTSDGAMTITMTIAPTDTKVVCTTEQLHRGNAPIGTKVKCYWKSDACYYTGVIAKKAIGSSKRYSVTFDDGERWRIPFTNLELV